MSALQELDLTDLDPVTIAALEEVARREHLLLSLQAQAEQEAFARAFPEMNAVNGLGQVRRNIADFAYHDWALKEQSYDCWNDKGFNRYIDRIAPETRVKCVAPNSGNGLPLMVGWTPPEGRRVRFSKTYEARGSEGGRERGGVESQPHCPTPALPYSQSCGSTETQ